MRLALLGDPVDHSRSPAIHAAALAALRIPGTYEARRCDAVGVTDAVAEMRRGALDGANVTMPLKGVALAAADTSSLEAIRAGAVNTLFVVGGEVRGENTDIGGLGDVADAKSVPASAPVLVLGAGGAAGAAIVAFEGREVRIAARRPEAAQRLIESTGGEASALEWGRGLEGALVVNATPLGMHGEELPEPVLMAGGALIDLAYGVEATPAVRFATGRMPVADGIDHLVAQAARSFTYWTGRPAPIEAMERAARV